TALASANPWRTAVPASSEPSVGIKICRYMLSSQSRRVPPHLQHSFRSSSINLQEEDGGRRAPSSVPVSRAGTALLSNGLIWMLRAFSDPHDRLKAGNRQERSVAEK